MSTTRKLWFDLTPAERGALGVVLAIALLGACARHWHGRRAGSEPPAGGQSHRVDTASPATLGNSE